METKDNPFLIPLSIVVAGALIGAGIYFSGIGSAPQPKNTQANATASGKPTREALLQGAVKLGNPDAKVVMVEYADFQCPFCGKFQKETMPLIVENYIKNGQVLFAYKDYAFLGDESTYAAEAAQCAGEQDKFWQYHDYLYKYLWDNYYSKNRNGENVGAFSKSELKKFANTLGLNTTAFNFCLDSGKYEAAVKESTEQGRGFGVDGTPAFFIEGELVTGALPYSQFKAALDEALKNTN